MGGESGGESATNVTVDAPSIFSGLNMNNNILSKQITTSHTKVIVISRRLAEAGIENICMQLKEAGVQTNYIYSSFK